MPIAGKNDASTVNSPPSSSREAVITAAAHPETAITAPLRAEIVPIAPRNAARELVDAFFRGRNPNTLRAYRKDLENFTSFLELPTVEDAARKLLSSAAGDANALVLRYRAAMTDQKVSPSVINRRLAAVKALVKVARTIGLVSWEILIEGVRSDAYRDTRGPGKEGVEALFAHVRARTDAKGLRDAAIVRLLYDCGMRRGEVVSLDRAHFNVMRGLSILGKGRIERQWITLPPSTQSALERWLSIRGAAPGPLFIALSDNGHRGHRLTGMAVYQIVRELGESVGVKARPHGLRHTAITEALDRTNGNMREVQRFSRHRSMQTLMIYDDNRRDDAGKIANLIALPEESRTLILSCARGHEYGAEYAGGKFFCRREECKGGTRGDPARRIAWR